MKYLFLWNVVIPLGAVAAVDNSLNDKNRPDLSVLSEVEIPVSVLPETDMGLLEQLAFRVSSGEQDKQQIWNKVSACENCHGNQMVYNNGYLPVIQGQNIEYLFSKLRMFKNNRRSHHPLRDQLKSLKNEDLMDMAWFYAKQSGALRQQLVLSDFEFSDRRGRVVSMATCLECHGESGNGNQLIPAISGQNKKYLSYRIREIANQGSAVHVDSDAPLSCRIDPLDIRRSRQLASLLSVVFDQQRAQLGKQVYRQKCSQCHQTKSQANSVDGVRNNWSGYLLQGTWTLIRRTLGGYHQPGADRELSLSEKEISNAIHFMIAGLRHAKP